MPQPTPLLDKFAYSFLRKYEYKCINLIENSRQEGDLKQADPFNEAKTSTLVKPVVRRMLDRGAWLT
jgi:hypothetical protein